MTVLKSNVARNITFDTQTSRMYDVVAVERNRIDALQDSIAEEVPIAMVYNGISHAVMLATPADLKDFALGFSLSEGILDSPSDLYGIEVVVESEGIALHLEIASQCFARLKETRRSMTGRTGCGLCGTESLAKALRLPVIAEQTSSSSPTLSHDLINQAFTGIRHQQALQASTGATHASAWANDSGEVVLLREDVGRHNALDKLVGALALMSNIDIKQGFIITTSRASVEMVQKAIAAGVYILVAVSAPTGLAIRVAEIYGLTLIGFAREDRFVVYSHGARVRELTQQPTIDKQ